VRTKRAAPPGLGRFAPYLPPLKRWATLCRPSGTSSNTEGKRRALTVVEIFCGTDPRSISWVYSETLVAACFFALQGLVGQQ